MRHPIEYSSSERLWLAALGVFGFVAVNGAFFYGLLFKPESTEGRPWGQPLKKLEGAPLNLG